MIIKNTISRILQEEKCEETTVNIILHIISVGHARYHGLVQLQFLSDTGNNQTMPFINMANIDEKCVNALNFKNLQGYSQ